MPKLSELTPYGQWAIQNRITRELKDFKKSSIWWARGFKTPGAEASPRMFQHFKAFIKFRRAVLDDGELVACLQDWVGCHEPLHNAAFRGKRNVPQLSFQDIIEQAIRDLEAIAAMDAAEAKTGT